MRQKWLHNLLESWLLRTLIALGAVSAIYGVIADPGRTWPNLLLDGFYVTSLAVSALFFLATQRLSGARWSASLRRIPEALMLILPVASLFMLVLYFGKGHLYGWSVQGNSAETAVGGKSAYLQAPYAAARGAIVLLLWSVFAWRMRTVSLRQDRDRAQSLTWHHRLNSLSALFVVLFAVSFTVASYDWLMSLDASWSSTMFAVYTFAGAFVQGIAAVTLAAVFLRRSGHLLHAPGKDQLHDLGKLLFAFSTFWAYIWVCQYLLIWYGNIPDEVTYYVARTSSSWRVLFLLNFVINWIIPFCILLPARTKRDPIVLRRVSILLLCGHWFDLYLLIMPCLWKNPKFGPLELTIAAGYGALVCVLFLRNLAAAPIVPLHDPVLIADAFAHALHTAYGEES